MRKSRPVLSLKPRVVAVARPVPVPTEASGPTAESAKPPVATPRSQAPPPCQPSVKPALAWLFATYPTLFRHQDKKPLKIGIHQELIPLMRAAGFSLKVAKRAIHFYVTRLSYQIALVQGGHRYDLADNPCGQVTPAEQEMARDKVKQLLKAGAENKPKKRVNHS